MIEWIHYTQRRKPRQTGKWGAAAPEAEKCECSECSLHERGKKAELFHELCFSTFENYDIIRTFHKDRREKAGRAGGNEGENSDGQNSPE